MIKEKLLLLPLLLLDSRMNRTRNAAWCQAHEMDPSDNDRVVVTTRMRTRRSRITDLLVMMVMTLRTIQRQQKRNTSPILACPAPWPRTLLVAQQEAAAACTRAFCTNSHNRQKPALPIPTGASMSTRRISSNKPCTFPNKVPI
jgi:hypothetical protein